MRTIEATPPAAGLRVAVVVSKYNDFVTDRLQAGALAALAKLGVVERRHHGRARAGRLRDPLAAHQAAASATFDAVVCLGCLIRGATAHFEYIASAVSHGITAAAAATGVPIAFGVLTTNSVEEAHRARGRRPGQQGLGSRGGRRRDGHGHRAASRSSEETKKTAAPRRRRPCRSSISGTSARPTSIARSTRSSICSGRTPIRPPTTCARSPRRSRRTRSGGSPRSTR